MSRFSNLEFDGESEQHAHSVPLAKDETYYLREAQAAVESGGFEQALRSYAKVLEHNPHNASAWSGQVRMLIELGEFREAKLWADKALQQFPHEPDLLAAKAVALARLGDIKNALAFSDASMEERGDGAYVWLARGDVLLAAKSKKASACIDQALLRFRDWLTHWLASRVYYYYGKISLATKVAQQGIAIDPSRSILWLQLGYCQAALGIPSLAANSFQHALELNPRCRAAVAASAKLTNDGPFQLMFRRMKRWFQR